jgi:hypothetical protein
MRCSRIKWHNYRSVVEEKNTNDNIWSFLHSNMVDSLMSIVLPGTNRNRVGSTGRCKGRHSCLMRVSMWIGALVDSDLSLHNIGLPFNL